MMMLTDEEKAELVTLLKHAEREVAGSDGDCGCGVCGEFDYHTAQCALGRWLRTLGGEAERQRQVDDAHGYAAYVHTPSRLTEQFKTRESLEALVSQVLTSDFDSDLIFKK